jgi:hydroxymethylpyrimidine kinase/phosphomethylpyrimidine kinase
MRSTVENLTIAGMKLALTIAGSDPTGGAGLQLDLRVFQHFGVHGLSAITALTTQDTHKVHQSLPIFPSVVLDQIRLLARDVTPSAIKLGMLASDDVARQVARGIADFETRPPLIIDPILFSSSGHPLLERRAWGVLCELFDEATLITPNLSEAEALSQCDVSDETGLQHASQYFIDDCGAQAVLIKGGHRDGPPDDFLARRGDQGIETTWLRNERIPGDPVHGTGCALSAAITAQLAKGVELLPAIEESRQFVARAYAQAQAHGGGARLLSFGL